MALAALLLLLSITTATFGKYIHRYHRKSFSNSVKSLVTANKLLREKIDFDVSSSDDSTFVILAFGQSNSANSSNFLYESHNTIINYYKGNTFIAKEPLLGMKGGLGGSVWTIFADKLIDNRMCRNVVVIPIGISGTNINCWSSGRCNTDLVETLGLLRQKNIKATHIFWHQGEADNSRISKGNYKDRLVSIINTVREFGQDAPFYCSIASYAPKRSALTGLGIDANIQQAQIETINEMPNVLAGPNTDKLIYAIDRFDGQHFSEIGLDRYSDLLMQSVIDGAEEIQQD
ncbi:hypothetical protein H8S90_08745 [Olivibacter sp. SDN3]|uniref:sialate O-acetylesterase n=1 Tax=Olivibacter sp. SDN3 TaxID=2764720 RepID=UPI0016515DF4|nr:sialate O-acetylesterase [Olivibacter sp. SDN3]QNL51642.1 hypothetical protein H8S90_08745 [Olivibacter sp. SDN3]